MKYFTIKKKTYIGYLSEAKARYRGWILAQRLCNSLNFFDYLNSYHNTENKETPF